MLIKCQLYELETIQTMQVNHCIKDDVCSSSSLSTSVLDLYWHNSYCKGGGPKGSFDMRKHTSLESESNTELFLIAQRPL